MILNGEKPKLGSSQTKQQNEKMEVYGAMGNKRELLNYLLGNGDLNTAKVWFVGIEEAEEWTEEYLAKIEGYENKDYNPVESGQILKQEKERSEKGEKFTSVYDIMSKIVVGLQGDEWQNNWKEYRNEKLFMKGSEVFQINLYPLGKKHVEDWRQEYEEWFGFTSKKQYYEWISENKSVRFAQIRKKRKEHGNPLSICFGKSFWSDFIKCFKLEETLYTGYQDTFIFYKEEKVILVPFFWYGGKSGMTPERTAKFIEYINKLKLNPFTKM